MNTKIYLIIFASAFGVLIVSAIFGNILESNGTLKTLSPIGIAAVKLFYVALFCVLCFSLIPLLLTYFISAQIKIGNGESFLIQWLQAHEKGFIYGFWALCVIGLCMAVPAAIKAGFFK
jgi:Cu/Ag efflux pump CusA